MVIDQSTLARRIREAREAAGVTQEQAATALSIPRTAVVQMESGNRAVSSIELLKLAALYRKTFADFFREDQQETNEDPIIVLHRIAPGLEGDPEVSREVEHCLTLCREGAALEGMLGRDSRNGPPAYSPSIPRNAGEAVRQAAEVAKQERLRLGLGEAPIADVADLLNAQGIWATGVQLPDHMSGLFLNHPSTGMVVLANIDHAETRKRFSLAHEYAHALLDREQIGTVSSKENASELMEKRANAFAAAFLMPESGIQQFLHSLRKGQPSRIEHSVFDVATEGRIDAQLRPEPGSQTIGYQDVVRIADWFRVSYKAAVYRLRSLNIIGQSECDGLLKQEDLANQFRRMLSMWGDFECKMSEKKPDRELVTQVLHLAIEAYRQGEISRGRIFELAEILDVDGNELLSLAEAAKAD